MRLDEHLLVYRTELIAALLSCMMSMRLTRPAA